jgi:hypothetical protein
MTVMKVVVRPAAGAAVKAVDRAGNTSQASNTATDVC